MKVLIFEISILVIVTVGLIGYYNITPNTMKTPKNDISDNSKLKTAYFSAGCFWCTESSFEKHTGIIEVISGYAGGTEESPTYEDVSHGKTSHRESVKVTYDSTLITYNKLLDIFWRTANPTDSKGQYVDRGFQYTSAIFYSTEEERNEALQSKEILEKSERYNTGIVTPILKFSTFYKAEEYHQDYYLKNPIRYKLYTSGSGRKEHLEAIWGEDLVIKENPKNISPNKSNMKNKLTDLQYYVTQKKGTEPSFNNEYWDNKDDGIYVDIIDGTPLFSSKDKYVSGTGWPSFVKPIDLGNIIEVEDNTLFSKRVEIRSKKANSHLGHVFPDGPIDRGGLRYCMNSASLRFVPVSDLEKEGYKKYKGMFNDK